MQVMQVMHGFRHHRAGILKDSFRHTCFLILMFLCSYTDSLNVTIPLRNVAAARGHVAVLGCEFSPHFGPNPDLSSLLVTWQRQEDNRVVHSFYYNRDQLDIQDPAYRDRTALFGSELSKGNASLKLRNIQKSDEGLYLCTVSTSQGTNKATLKLDYGVLYTEPKLTIKASSSGILMHFEMEGFPEPEVKWKREHGESLSDPIQTFKEFHSETGLYNIQSSYTAPNAPFNVTFILKNQLLGQYLQRPISYTGGENSCFAVAIALSVISLLLISTAAALGWICCCKKKNDLA